jgi:hypothetical protein
VRVIYAEVSRWLVLGLSRIERLSDRLFEGEEAVLHMIECIVARSSGRRNVALGGRAVSGRI